MLSNGDCMQARPVAINTYPWIWHKGVRETVAHLADQGWTRTEILINAPHCWPEALSAADRADVARLTTTRGLSIVSLNPPMLDLNLVSPSPGMRRYSIDHYKQVVELAGDWGAPLVVVVPGKVHPLLPAPAEHVWSWFEAAIAEIDKHAERNGVRLCLENLPMAFLPTADRLSDALDRLGNERLGICYDVANAMFAREAPDLGLRQLAHRVRHVHLSDTGLEKWGHAPIGTGIVPFDRIAQAMSVIGEDTVSVLEIIAPDGDRAVRSSHERLPGAVWEAPPRLPTASRSG